jgi:hypothetical protein
MLARAATHQDSNATVAQGVTGGGGVVVGVVVVAVVVVVVELLVGVVVVVVVVELVGAVYWPTFRVTGVFGFSVVPPLGVWLWIT